MSRKRNKNTNPDFTSRTVKGMNVVIHSDGDFLRVYADVSNSILDGLEIGVDSCLKDVWCRYGMKYLGEGIPGYNRHKDKYWCGWRYNLSILPKDSVTDDVINQDIRGFVNRLNLLSRPWYV